MGLGKSKSTVFNLWLLESADAKLMAMKDKLYFLKNIHSVSGSVKFKSQLYKGSLIREHSIANGKMLSNIRFVALQTTKTEKAD